ncbi:MAG: leucine-rich repeat domain-containing protein [Alistipes sp.]|nr:leucine-rich repeat domain-containing protein [Alistipes sp.]
MKKLLLLLAAVGTIFTACQSGSLDDGSNGGNGSGNSEVYDPNNPLNNKKCSNNEILYISKSCLSMELNTYDGWGAKLISNTYENGVGRLTFNGEVTTIPKNAFSGNDLLEFIKMPKSVTSIGYRAFADCSSLTSATIGNGVNTIGEYAFYNCDSLTSITIPDSVTSIGNSAFDGCTSLTIVTIPDSVTSIGDYVFSSCKSLTSITIPNSVTSIGEFAFAYCSSLTSVYCKPTTPPAGNSSMFNYNASGRKIYVPRNSVSAYKSAKYWSEYASCIEGYDF